VQFFDPFEGHAQISKSSSDRVRRAID